MKTTKAEKQIIEAIRKSTGNIKFGEFELKGKIYDNKITNVKVKYVEVSQNINYDKDVGE